MDGIAAAGFGSAFYRNLVEIEIHRRAVVIPAGYPDQCDVEARIVQQRSCLAPEQRSWLAGSDLGWLAGNIYV